MTAHAARSRETARHSDGKFGEQHRGEADLNLAAVIPACDWGQVTGVPNRGGTVHGFAQWGKVTNTENPAPGVVIVDCEGHGGVKLSPQRQATIPKALRRTWYEEDSEANIVAMYHPDAFPNADPEHAEMMVRNWHPIEYMEATGNTVTEEESPQLARLRATERLQAAADAAGRPIVGWPRSSQVDGWETVTVGNINDDRMWAVPAGTVTSGMVLPADAIDLSDLNSDPVYDASINTDSLTAREKEKAEQELGCRIRGSEGRSSTLREWLEAEPLEGKAKQDGKWVVYRGNRGGFGVSAATAKALTGVPDTTPASVAPEEKVARIERRRKAAARNSDTAAVKRLWAELESARDEVSAALMGEHKQAAAKESQRDSRIAARIRDHIGK